MGSYLLMETLRQIRMSAYPVPASRFGVIALAASDIDLFKQQLKHTGRPDKPFLILLSHNDKALKVSSLLAGGKQRVDRYENTEELASLGTFVIDLTNIDGESSVNHDKFAQIAQIAPELGATLQNSKLGETVGAPSPTGDLIGRGTNMVLTLPQTILSAPAIILSGQ